MDHNNRGFYIIVDFINIIIVDIIVDFIDYIVGFLYIILLI